MQGEIPSCSIRWRLVLRDIDSTLPKVVLIHAQLDCDDMSFMLTSPKELLNTWQASVIKGNAAEIGALAQSDEVRSFIAFVELICNFT